MNCVAWNSNTGLLDTPRLIPIFRFLLWRWKNFKWKPVLRIRKQLRFAKSSEPDPEKKYFISAPQHWCTCQVQKHEIKHRKMLSLLIYFYSGLLQYSCERATPLNARLKRLVSWKIKLSRRYSWAGGSYFTSTGYLYSWRERDLNCRVATASRPGHVFTPCTSPTGCAAAARNPPAGGHQLYLIKINQGNYLVLIFKSWRKQDKFANSKL